MPRPGRSGVFTSSKAPRNGCPVTGFVIPVSRGLTTSGLNVLSRSSFSVNTPGISQRSPKFTVSLSVICHESSAK
jgi:hypothetical protein